MHKTEREIRTIYRYSALSYVFDVYMECEYRANLTQEEYDGLLPGEFRFDYESWGRRLGFTKKQMERAIKELTTKNVVIIQTEKGARNRSSKYFLTRFKSDFEEKNKGKDKESKRRIINVENTKVECDKGEEREKKKENKKEHSSRYNNLDIESNNIYSHIFDYWISKNIKKHRKMTAEIKKAIDKTLKEYTQEEIVQAINNYGTMYNDKNCTWCTYQWGLNEFLLRKDKDGIRQLGMFLDDGSKYCNYIKATQTATEKINYIKHTDIVANDFIEELYK